MDKPSKPRVQLDDWSTWTVNNPYLPPESQPLFLHGIPTGHPRERLNGVGVNTSRIVSVQGDEAETSHTIYILGKPNAEFMQHCKDKGHYVPTKEVPIRVIN